MGVLMSAIPKIDKNLAIGVGGLALVGIVVYLFFKKEIKDGANAAGDLLGGLVSGNNAVTRGTTYEGAGIGGTLGAAANSASGGLLETFGHWLGGKAADVSESISATFEPRTTQVRKTAALYESLLAPPATYLSK